MSWFRRFASRLRGLFFRGRLETELEDELRFHLEMQTEENVQIGMDLESARYNAMCRFGAIESVKETYREHGTLLGVEALFRDISYAWRTFRQNPGFTAVAVITLALAIGVNITVFTVANAILFKGFPFVDRNDRILYLDTRYAGCCVSYPDFQDWRTQAKSFEGMAVVHGVQIVLGNNNGFSKTYDATQVSANTFRLIGQKPILGRDFTSSDELPGAAPVAILSYDFWERRYGKDPSIIGKALRIKGVSGNGISTTGAPTTVIGIMPPGVSFPQNQDLWLALTPTPDLQKREARVLWFAFGRLAEGVTTENARAEMETIGRRLASSYPLTNSDQPPVVQTFQEFVIGRNATTLYGSMWGGVGCVLLIACANLANLMLARSIGRSRDISIRIALGAGKWRIVRQLLIESLLLSVGGSIVGWWIAKGCVREFSLAAYADWQQPWFDFTMDYRVLGYLIAIAIGTAILFGLAPVSRLSKLDINGTLKDGGHGATGTGVNHLSALLVTGEMALALVLLVGAGVMIRSFLKIYTADLGVKTSNVLMANVQLPEERYSQSDARIAFYDHLQTRLDAIPAVESAAITAFLPTRGSLKFSYELGGVSQIPTPKDERLRPKISVSIISPAYFRTLGAALLSGREFNKFDRASTIPVAIVNQHFASKYWPGESALGKHLRLFDGTTPEAWLTVIGVATNIVQDDRTGQESHPLVYLPYRQRAIPSMSVVVRTRVSPESLTMVLWREVQAIDPDLPIWGPLSLAKVLEMWNYRQTGSLTTLFLVSAAVALLLASVGLYAVIAHSISQRTQEIGIRLAVGATARDIRKLVFMQGMLPSGIGIAIGLPASLVLNQALKSELVHVSSADPTVIVAASAVLLLSASLGCLIPACRAVRVDPLIALRHE